MEYIDLKKQYQLYKNEIDAAIHTVLDQGCYILGPQVESLENRLAEYVGVKHALGISNGTDSLKIALMALGIGPGDEVITTAFTWVSTVEVIALIGATPVFVDIDPQTFCIDVTQIEKAITPRTKALMPVSLFGQMPDYTAINAIAKRHHLPVIEDGAQSFGATQHGRKSCSVTTIGSTSFFPAKVFGCYGDGGMLFMNDDELAEKCKAIRVHGAPVRGHFKYIGFTGRLDTIQAAVLLAKFPHFDGEIEARHKIGNRYSEHLSKAAIIPHVPAGNTHLYHQYTLRVANRDQVAFHLMSKKIPYAIHYSKGIHEQEAYQYLGYNKGVLPVTEKMCGEVLSIPMHPWLEEKDQDRIIEAILEVAVKPESEVEASPFEVGKFACAVVPAT